MRRLVFLLAFAIGCATVQTTAELRNPRFPEPVAAAPTLAFETVPCSAEGGVTALSAPVGPDLDTRLSAALGPLRVALDPPSVAAACAGLAHDRVLYDDLLLGTEWSVGADLTAAIQRAARVSGAGSVLLPLVRSRAACRPDDGFARDELGRPLSASGSIGEGCSGGGPLDVGLFLFSADGTLLWKSTGSAARPEQLSLAPVLGRVVQGLAAELHRPPANTAVAKPSPP